MAIQAELQKQFTSPYIELYEIDGRTIDGALYFHFTPSSTSVIEFGGFSWDPFPIRGEGWEVTSEQPPRPKIFLSNVTKIVQPYFQTYDDLIRVRITRRRTLGRYITGGEDAAEPEEMPIQLAFINSLQRHENDMFELECAFVYDLPNVKLPFSQALKDQTSSHNMWAPGLSTIRFRS